MHGIVSLLDQEHYTLVEELWRELQEKCGLEGIKVTPYPHFSWQIGVEYEWTELEKVFHDIAIRTKPFVVHTTGLALFTGDQPVIFIPLVRDPALNAFHAQVWDRLAQIGEGISPHYSPRNWMPHISLAYSDVTRETINCAMQTLAFRAYDWRIEVDNLAAIYEPAGTVGKLRLNVRFKG